MLGSTSVRTVGATKQPCSLGGDRLRRGRSRRSVAARARSTNPRTESRWEGDTSGPIETPAPRRGRGRAPRRPAPGRRARAAQHLALDQDAAGGGAALARLGEGRRRDARDGAVEVGVRQDDGGVLAAELGQQPDVATGEGRLQRVADVVRPREADGLQRRVLEERPADLAARSGDGVQHARRQPGVVQHPGQLEGDDRGVGGGLEDDAVPGDQRRSELARGREQGVVPRA